MRKTHLIIDLNIWAVFGTFLPVHTNFTNPAAGLQLRGSPSRII